MKKVSFILYIIFLSCILISCTLQIASAVKYSYSNEDEIIDKPVEELLQNPIKLPTLDGLDVNDNYFSWNPSPHIDGYEVRIAGLDRVKRSIIDRNYQVKADQSFFLLPELNEGEYFLLVKAKSNNEEYFNSDWAFMEYKIGVEASDGIFEDCHNDWSGFYLIFESTEDTEGLEARYCLTCLKTHYIRNAALSTNDEWMIFSLINGGMEYSVRAHSVYSEKPYEEVTIPAYHKGKPVTQIERLGFYRMLNLKTVVIPNTVTKIDDGAFANCPNLQAIIFDKANANYKFDAGCLIEIDTNKVISGTNNSVIPSYITSIGSYAFYALKMTHLFIPASVKEIGDWAFVSCEELISVVFEKGSELEKISFGMFSGCISLKDIVLSDNIKIIDKFAFECCTSIESLIVPRNCIYIGELAFVGWTSSQTIYIIAFASKAEADNAFSLDWDICDRENNFSAKFIFLG